MVAQVTIQALAKELAESFETRKRDNGSEFVTISEAASQSWVREAIIQAHEDALPNSSITAMCKTIAEEILEELESIPYFQYGDDVDMHERFTLIADAMPNYDLRLWLLENPNANAAIDSAIANYYYDPKEGDFNLHELLKQGYYTQLDEMAGSLCRAMGEEYERRNKDAN